MSKKIESIQQFAKELIMVDSSAGMKEVYTKMLSEDISLIPIIDNNGKRNVGLYRRKEIFKWLIENPGKLIEKVDLNFFKRDPLPEVNTDTSLQSTMKLLHNHSAILVKNKQQNYSHLISPRVVANALEEYSLSFMVFEALEKTIRHKIAESSIELKDYSGGIYTLRTTAIEKLDFGQYITIFARQQKELGLGHLDRKTLLSLLNSAREYRNALMHFRFSSEDKGLEAAQNLIKLLT